MRGWHQGTAGLAFLGILVGTLFAAGYNYAEFRRYTRKRARTTTTPEDRLPLTMVGAIAVPIGLFWFAFTNGPEIHWLSSVAAGVPFGFGIVVIFLGIETYLVDSYVIFSASVLAANTFVRSVVASVFPLFTTYLYKGAGIHWASSIPAFLALACAPFPFIFYRYGAEIRKRCRFSAQAEAYLKKVTEGK